MYPRNLVEWSVMPNAVLEPVVAAKPKIGFVSLGCPKNLVDSEVMMGLLHHNGAELTPKAEDAEIIVINTCSFIDSAKQESVNTILEMVQHKQQNGGKAQRIVVAGCLVERYRDEIQKNIPEVDAVVGTGELRVGRRVEPFTATEVADDDKPAILRAYLKRWKFEVGVFFDGVDAKAPEEKLREIAPGYPIFRVAPAKAR